MLRARQKLGKYRIRKRIASGPLADVYIASDTIQRAKVALKIPKTDDHVSHDDFLREVQIATRLNHPNILPIKDASFIDDYFVIAMELGRESLGDRIERRISTAHALELADQGLAALAHAHERKIIHCDIKPENFILFPDNCLKLADFGFAKISLRTLKASGSGTIDYIAPEQAMGRPKFQSDVFSMGLVLYRLFSGKLPEWPFKWPLPGDERLRKKLPPAAVEVIRKSMQLDPADRYRSAVEMYRAFQSARRSLRSKQRAARRPAPAKRKASWRNVQWRQFNRRFRTLLDSRLECRHCQGPVAESMHYCPWCGHDHPSRGSDTTMPAMCPRCERGVKTDWPYCAWCFGAGFEVENSRHYPDRRYVARCSNRKCQSPLMPFMKYCPWCRVKVRRRWRIGDESHACRGCGWGVAGEFWDYCAWCGIPVER